MFLFQMVKRGFTPSSSKKTKIVCRICGPEKTKINRQSYRDHLRLIHQDTSGDLREWGQKRLDLFGATSRQESRRDAAPRDDPEDESQEDQDVHIQDDQEDDPQHDHGDYLENDNQGIEETRGQGEQDDTLTETHDR
jgi:hypothetical protein